MGDLIVYCPIWNTFGSKSVSINYHIRKTGINQDFLRQIRIYGDFLQRKSTVKTMYREVQVKFNIFPPYYAFYTALMLPPDHRIIKSQDFKAQIGLSDHLCPYPQKMVHQTGSIGMIWKLVRNAEPQAPADLLHQNLHFKKIHTKRFICI